MSEAQDDSDFAARVIDLMGARHAKAAPRADAEDEIARLSHLDDLELELEMADAAKRLNIGVPTVRKLVKETRRRRRTAEAVPPHGEEPPPAAGEPPRWPRGFTMTGDGLLARPAEEVPPVWVCSPFEMLGEARSPEGEGWSKWIRWRDADGRAHEMPVEAALLHKVNGDLEARLADRGLRVSADPRTRGLLRQALAGVRSGTRATLVPRPGWAVLGDGSRGYVFPDGGTAGGASETLILHPPPENGRNLSGTVGSLEEWKRDVAALAVGNAPVLFCVSAAFAGPLLEIVGEVSGGFHFAGGSKAGKSLMARPAVSVWGLPFEEGAFRSWNSTVNAMETSAEAANDGLLALDEIAQAAAPDKVVKAIYAIANQAGKDHMTKDANGRPRRSWRTVVLSTGEKDLAAVAAEANQKVPAGAEVRMPCIRTEAHDTWPELHGHGSLEQLAAALCAAMRRHHGTAGRAFVERLARLDADGREELRRGLDRARAWMLDDLPPGACGQVRDVARRFALVAFAGELATEWGVLPWEQGSARVAARSMMRRWLDARGGVGSSEESQTLEAVRAFLLAAGPARFVALAKNGEGRWEEVAPDRPVANRAGWRRPDGYGGEEFLIEPSLWKVECAKLGLDPATAVRALRDKGHLGPGDGKHLARHERIPGVGNPRVYRIKGSIFGGDAEGSGAA